jgi:CHAD domain-containing protein
MLADGGQQMTTDRTAIRRWLSVGGAAHRPPVRLGKSRHRSIVAPLTAALGVSALGVGLILANGRLSERRQRRERRPGVLAGEQVAEALRRMALGQVNLALEQLEGITAANAAEAVHEARKAIKRLRTIMRLLEGVLGRPRCAAEDGALRAAARGLSGSRDAEVLLATLEGLVRREGKRLKRARGVRRLRRRLERERDAAQQRMLEDPAALRLVVGELRAFRARASDWQLDDRHGIAPVEAGLRRIYGQGRRRWRRAGRGGGSRTRAMHRWRKRVKDLRYATEMLGQLDRGPGSMSTALGLAGRGTPGKPDRMLRTTARRADKLGELLGEEHDLAVLGEWVQEQGKQAGATRRERRRLIKRIAKRRRKLRKRALRDGGRLYRRGTGKFLRRVAKADKRRAFEVS